MPDLILKHLPKFYKDIEDFKELDKTETIELNLLQESIEQEFDDQFITSSSVQAIKRREQMLGIQADPSETLEFRKRRILNRYQTKPPFTIRYLQQQLDMLVGKGLTLVSVDYDSHLLTITANIDNASVFREVLRTIDTVKPANLVYQQNTPFDEEILLEERIKMQRMSWNYTLDGGWNLGEKSFVTFGTEVVIK